MEMMIPALVLESELFLKEHVCSLLVLSCFR